MKFDHAGIIDCLCCIFRKRLMLIERYEDLLSAVHIELHNLVNGQVSYVLEDQGVMNDKR